MAPMAQLHHMHYNMVVPPPPQRRIDEELVPTAEGIINECPRFRILVLGKAGAGKSSIINYAFNVDLAQVSHDRPGQSDINTEIMSDSNPRFVLHDSQGFEPGDTTKFETVRDFIRMRSEQPRLADKLHAIWLCIEIPRAGGRVFETGDVNFLSLDLRGVPVIVVFTKYDLLLRKVELTIDDSLPDAEFEAELKAKADEAFEEICLRPLRRRNCNYPYAKVTIKNLSTLAKLVETTKSNVEEAVWVIWAVAQRASADVNIDASIAVGKKKYWRGLASTINVFRSDLQRCLDVIHEDIISIWNFHDPMKHLKCAEFKALISNLVKDLADPEFETTNPSRNFVQGLAGVGSIAGTILGIVPLSGPAAPVMIAVAAGLVLAKWVYDIAQDIPGTLRCLMGYIVDLTIVMQSLFWLMHARGGAAPISRRLVKLAFNAYYESPERVAVHDEIQAYVKKGHVWNVADRDHALEEIERLIAAYRFDPTKHREYIAPTAGSDVGVGEEEEPWDATIRK